jgi:hypothetical protein
VASKDKDSGFQVLLLFFQVCLAYEEKDEEIWAVIDFVSSLFVVLSRTLGKLQKRIATCIPRKWR